MNRYVLNIARNDAAIAVRQPSVYVMFFVLPILVTSYLVPLFGVLLRSRGYATANGSELVVPGMTVMFGFFVMAFAGHLVLEEYQAGTWTRLRALPARPVDVLLGKSIVPLAIALVQQALLFTVGIVFFDMSITGSRLALVVVVGCFTLVVGGLGIVVLAIARSPQQVSLMSNASLLVLGGLGSSFAPPDLMPSWARAIAPVTPGYWAIRALRGIVLDGDGLRDVTSTVAVLLAWAAAATLLGVSRFRSDARRGTMP